MVLITISHLAWNIFWFIRRMIKKQSFFVNVIMYLHNILVPFSLLLPPMGFNKTLLLTLMGFNKTLLLPLMGLRPCYFHLWASTILLELNAKISRPFWYIMAWLTYTLTHPCFFTPTDPHLSFYFPWTHQHYKPVDFH